jgi:hypothetical protein
MLSAAQLSEFERDGVVKVPAAFAADDAARMRDVLWTELARRHGINRGDRSTWTTLRPTGLKTTKKHPAANAILGPPLRSALDDLLGPGAWTESRTLLRHDAACRRNLDWRFGRLGRS